MNWKKNILLGITVIILGCLIMFKSVNAEEIDNTQEIEIDAISSTEEAEEAEEAEEKKIKNTNIEKMSKDEVNDLTSDLCRAAVNSTNSLVDKYEPIFEDDAYNNYQVYVSGTDFNGILSEVVTDYIYPEDSTTGDTVLMCNARILNNNSVYNKVYLFEFHINAEGKIYGYNVWSY